MMDGWLAGFMLSVVYYPERGRLLLCDSPGRTWNATITIVYCFDCDRDHGDFTTTAAGAGALRLWWGVQV